MFHWEGGFIFQPPRRSKNFWWEWSTPMNFFFVSYLLLVNCSALYNNQPKKFKAAPKKKSLEKWTSTPYAIRHNSFSITCCGDDDKKSLKRANLKKRMC